MSFFELPFMQHALLAGSAIALASGLVGYFVVLRAQVFTGDALSHVAFTGALAALAAGLDPQIGLFVFTLAVALFMGLLGQKGRADDAIIGSIFAWILGLGVLFLTLYVSSQAAATGGTSVSVLFGSILGLSGRQALLAAIVGAGVVAVLVVIGRPLLLLGLLAAPAGTAHRLTSRPYLGFWLSGLLAVAEMWAGLITSYAVPRVPPSFAILAVAAGVYFAVLLGTGTRFSRLSLLRRLLRIRAGETVET
jgi:zinc/manganese transport system permease protein